MNDVQVKEPLPAVKAQPRTEHFLGIQVLRGVAAMLVVIHHTGQLITDTFPGAPKLGWLERGAFGVDLFFPISGFVILLSTWSLLRKAKGNIAADFAERRVVRVVPLYWLCTGAKVLLAVLVPSLMRTYRVQVWNAMASFLFLFSYSSLGQPTPVLMVGWTLNYEMFFYLLVLVALVAGMPLLPWCSGVLGVLALVGLFLPHTHALAYFAHPIELEFLAGMFLAANAQRLKRISATWGLLLLVCGIVPVMLYPAGPEITWSLMRPLVWGIPGALIVAAVIALESKAPRLSSWRPLLLLGDASYALYLTHGFVLPPLGKLAAKAHLHGPTGAAVFFALSAAVCALFAVLVHLGVELPLLRALLGRRTPWSLRSAGATA